MFLVYLCILICLRSHCLLFLYLIHLFDTILFFALIPSSCHTFHHMVSSMSLQCGRRVAPLSDGHMAGSCGQTGQREAETPALKRRIQLGTTRAKNMLNFTSSLRPVTAKFLEDVRQGRRNRCLTKNVSGPDGGVLLECGSAGLSHYPYTP